LAFTRRTARQLRKVNPVRDLVSEKQRAVEAARSRQKVQQFHAELPSLIENQVGEHMQRLESKLVSDFREMGQRAIEESTAALNEQLDERIQTLEKVSEFQSRTLLNLRDTSILAEQKVSSAVDSIERSLAGAVPGFKLAPPPPPPQTGTYDHPQFQIAARGEREKPELSDEISAGGYCPSCTSTNIRRSNRQGFLDQALRLFFVAPYRCRACRRKFYRF